MIGTDCIGSCKSKHHTITATTTSGLQLVSYLIAQSVFATWGCFVYSVFIAKNCWAKIDFCRGGKLLAHHRQALSIEEWQGRWGYTILLLIVICSVCNRLGWLMNVHDLVGPHKTTPRYGRLIAQCAKRNCSAALANIWDDLNFEGYVLIRTDNNEQRLSARRFVKRSQLSWR